MRRLVAMLVITLTVVSCGTRSRKPRADGADSDANQATLGKLQGYLDCLNEHSAGVFRIADLYAARLAGQPPASEADVQLVASPDPEKCITAITAAQARLPALPVLDAAGTSFAAALRDVFTLTTEATRAFDRTDPKTYDPAKGLALHPRLIAAFGAFDLAQAALFDQVVRLNHAVHADQIARLEQRNGRTLAVLVDAVMLRAELGLRTAAVRWDAVAGLDAPAFAKQVAELEVAIETMVARSVAEPAEASAFMELFGDLIDAARDYVVAARQLERRARDAIAYTEAEKIMIAAGNEAGVVGTPAAMIHAYNWLVAVYRRR